MLIDENRIAVWVDQHQAGGTGRRLVRFKCQRQTATLERPLER